MNSKDVFGFNSKRQGNKETITPHKIAILLLIKEQCWLLSERQTPLPAFKKSFCMIALKLIQSPDLDFKTFKTWLRGKIPDYRVAPALLARFSESVDEILKLGVGSLLDVLVSGHRLIGTTVGCVTKASVLGLFVRRVLLHFDQLTFSEVVQLYENFREYADPTKQNTSNEEEKLVKWSRKQAELFFAREAAKLLTEEPGPLQYQISQLLQSNPDFAEAHFLSFLNCVRSKELSGAKASLHHCYDRTLLMPDKAFSSSTTNLAGAITEEKNSRYATLSLAAMHASFNHKEEALFALKEAIKLAHKSADSVCLQHALSWLYTLTSENKEALMERSMAKCSDLGLSYLMSLAVQAYTKYCGLTGGRPSIVFDVVMKSDVLNCQHMLSELAANSYCLKAALWTLYGQSNMASLSSQQLLRLSSLQPAVCLALCTVARVLAGEGEYDFSLSVIKEAQEKFPRNDYISWMASYQEVFFQQFVNQSKFKEAHKAATLLGPLRPWESIIRKSWLHHWQGDNVTSMKLSQSVLNHCREGWYSDPELPPMKARALIAAAETLETGPALGCLLHALALAHTYYLHHLESLITLHIANIQLNLCMPSRALRLVEAVLPSVLSDGTLQEQGRALVLLARCKMSIKNGKKRPSVKQDMSVLKQAISILTQALELFKKAKDFVRVKHCFYLQALVYQELLSVPDRNRCAYEFRLLDADYTTPSSLATSF